MSIADFLTDRNGIGVSETATGVHPAVQSSVSNAVSNAIRDFVRSPDMSPEQMGFDPTTGQFSSAAAATDSKGNPTFNAGQAFGMFGKGFEAMSGISGMGTLAGVLGSALDVHNANTVLSGIPNTQPVSLASALIHNVTPFGLLGQSVQDQYMAQVNPSINPAYAPFGFSNYDDIFNDPFAGIANDAWSMDQDFGQNLGADFGLDANGGFGTNEGTSMGADEGLDADGGFGGNGGGYGDFGLDANGGFGSSDDNSGPGGGDAPGGDGGDSGGDGGDGGGGGDGGDGGDD